MKFLFLVLMTLTSTIAMAQSSKESCQNLKLTCGGKTQDFDANPNLNSYVDLKDSTCVARIDFNWRGYTEKYHLYVVAGDQNTVVISGSVTAEIHNVTKSIPTFVIPFQKDVPFKFRDSSLKVTCIVTQ